MGLDFSCSDFNILLYIIKFYDLHIQPIKYSFFLFQVPGTCVVRVLVTEGEHDGIIQQTSILVTNTCTITIIFCDGNKFLYFGVKSLCRLAKCLGGVK